MVDFKKVKAPNNTITRNPAVLAAKADNNIYEAVAIIAKRSNQIAVEMKEELSRKLQEFASLRCRTSWIIFWKRFLKIGNRLKSPNFMSGSQNRCLLLPRNSKMGRSISEIRQRRKKQKRKNRSKQ